MCAAAAATTDRVVIVVMGPTAAPSRLLLVVGGGGADPAIAGMAAPLSATSSSLSSTVVPGGDGDGAAPKLPTTRSRTLPEVTPSLVEPTPAHCRPLPDVAPPVSGHHLMRRADAARPLLAAAQPPALSQPPSAHGHLPRPTHSAFGGVERRQEEQRED